MDCRLAVVTVVFLFDVVFSDAQLNLRGASNRQIQASVVADLNSRFADAGDDLAHNVVMHQLGSCPAEAVCWKPCPRETSQQCYKKSDRFSTFLLSADVHDKENEIPVYSKVQGGMIVNLDTSAMLCGWPNDGATESRLCDPIGNTSICVPGCYSSGTNGSPIWCEDDAQPGYCPWRPSSFATLKDQIKARTSDYSELIFSAQSWVDNLPHTIEAFVIPSMDDQDEMYKVTKQWTDFRNEYGLSETQVPLVFLNRSNFVTPFTDISS
jgi:hypothetical protein